MSAHLFFCICDQKQQSVIRTGISDIWKARFFLLILAHTGHFRKTVAASCVARVEDEQLFLSQELKLTKISYKFTFQVFPRQLYQILPVNLLPRWGERFLVLLPLLSSQNPPYVFVYFGIYLTLSNCCLIPCNI